MSQFKRVLPEELTGDFVKKIQYVYYDENALAEVAQDVAYFARKEGLTAHAKSATVRLDNE